MKVEYKNYPVDPKEGKKMRTSGEKNRGYKWKEIMVTLNIKKLLDVICLSMSIKWQRVTLTCKTYPQATCKEHILI